MDTTNYFLFGIIILCIICICLIIIFSKTIYKLFITPTLIYSQKSKQIYSKNKPIYSEQNKPIYSEETKPIYSVLKNEENNKINQSNQQISINSINKIYSDSSKENKNIVSMNYNINTIASQNIPTIIITKDKNNFNIPNISSQTDISYYDKYLTIPNISSQTDISYYNKYITDIL